MGIHVNIGEAKTRLSELVSAALRGEDVVIAKAGEAQVRLTPVAPEDFKAARRDRIEKWIGSFEGVFPEDAGDLFLEPEFSDEELDEFEDAILNPRT